MKIIGANITGSFILNNQDVTNTVQSSSAWSGSVASQIDSLNAATASLYAVSASLNSATASLNAATSSLNTATASFSSSIGSLNAATASLFNTTASLSAATASLNAATSSLNTASASFSSSIASLNNATASLFNATASLFNATSSLNAATSSLNTASASFSSSIASLNTATASFSSSIGLLNGATASLNAATSSLSAATSSLNSSTASLSAATASLNNATASLNAATSSLNTATSSFSSSIASLNSFTSSQTALNNTFATTGSNNFVGNQVVSGSFTTSGSITATGTITAQTLVVQTITSSVSTVTGSTKFGSTGSNTHQFTGSVNVTGSLTVTTTGTELQVNSTGVNLGNALTDSHTISGSLTVNPGGLFVSGSGQIVGIGTTVGLSGNSRMQLLIGGNSFGSLIAMGNNSNPNKFRIESDSSENVLLNNLSNTPIIFYTSGSERMRITGDGLIGIGTNPTEGTQATSTLSLIPSSSVSGGPLIQFSSNGRIRPASTGDRLSIDGNALFLNGTFSGNIIMATGGGNVGVGTSSPYSRFTSVGSAVSWGENMTIYPASNGYITIALRLEGADSINGTWAFGKESSSSISANMPQYMQVLKNALTGSALHRVDAVQTWHPNGNALFGFKVGIGTTNPINLLHLQNSNSTYTSPEDTNVPNLYIYNSNSASTSAHSILTLRTNNTGGGNPFISFDVNTVIGYSIGIDNADSDKFKLSRSWASLGVNNLISVTTGGEVGIGTTNPSSLLHAYRDSDAWHARFGSSSGELRIGGATSSGAVIQSYTPGGTVRDLYIQRDGGKVGIGTTTPTATKLSLGMGIGAKFMIYDNPSTGVYSGIGQDLDAGNSIDLFAHAYANYGYITFGKLGTNGSTYTQWAKFDPSGNFNMNGGQIQSGGVGIVQTVPIGPTATNVSFTATINGQYTLGSTSIPSSARWLLADIFITADISDHQNFMFTRSNIGSQKSWVNTRGGNPASEFGNLTSTDIALCTYFGESDGFTSNYGIWYSSILIPSVGRTCWINNYGNSNSNGYVYIIVRGYSL